MKQTRVSFYIHLIKYRPPLSFYSSTHFTSRVSTQEDIKKFVSGDVAVEVDTLTTSSPSSFWQETRKIEPELYHFLFIRAPYNRNMSVFRYSSHIEEKSFYFYYIHLGIILFLVNFVQARYTCRWVVNAPSFHFVTSSEPVCVCVSPTSISNVRISRYLLRVHKNMP